MYIATTWQLMANGDILILAFSEPDGIHAENRVGELGLVLPLIVVLA